MHSRAATSSRPGNLVLLPLKCDRAEPCQDTGRLNPSFTTHGVRTSQQCAKFGPVCSVWEGMRCDDDDHHNYDNDI